MTNVNILLDKYYSWLKDKTAINEYKEWSEITTPYLDRHNDYIQIYLKKDGDSYLLTDIGDTISGLEDDGCALDSPKRKSLLKSTLQGFGVSLLDDQLLVKANVSNFPIKKHNLIQAILAVNDMFYLAEPLVLSFFFEDIAKWLDESNIRYSPNVSFIGKSGFARKFDFLISKSQNSPERILKAVNNPIKATTDALIMDWLDTKEQRQDNSQAYAVLNDNNREISQSVIDALENYEINTILWSKRQERGYELSS